MLQILLAIKFVIYTHIMKVEFNKIPIVIISTLIIMLLFSLIDKSSTRKIERKRLITYISISLLIFIDSLYFSHFDRLISVNLIKQIPQVRTLGGSIKQLLNFEIVILIIDIPLLIYKYRKHSKKTTDNIESFPVISTERSKWGNLLEPIAISMAIITTLTYFNAIGQLKSITTQEFFTYHITDIGDFIHDDELAEASETVSKSDIEELRNRRKLEAGALTGLGQNKNLIVLQIEALQDFVINRRYYGQEITPNINRLIRDSSTIYYDNYYQSVGRGNTSDAEFATQNSMYPSIGEATYLQYTDNNFYGLPWLLRDNGYTAWAFHGNEKDFWNRDKAYVNQGFQRFISKENYKSEEILGYGITDKDFFNESLDYLRILDKKDNPFYAFMISVTSHTPFELPEEYQYLTLREEDKDTLLGNYLQAVHYTDRQIGRFIKGLKARGIYEDTIIALYGDHYAINSTDEENYEQMTQLLGKPYDYDEMMNIPLLIHIPGEDINKTVSNIGSQIDFYPTIANIMGYKIEKGLIFGRDLNNYKGNNYVFPQMYLPLGSVITEDALFEMSKDTIFNHSSARKRNTGEELDISQFRIHYNKALDEIYKSNYILKNYLVIE